MHKQVISQNKVHFFPVFSDHALLVKINVFAFDLVARAEAWVGLLILMHHAQVRLIAIGVMIILN